MSKTDPPNGAKDTAWDASRFRGHWQRRRPNPTAAADAAGCTTETLRRWRRGTRVPDFVSAARLARFLGVQVAELLPRRF